MTSMVELVAKTRGTSNVSFVILFAIEMPSSKFFPLCCCNRFFNDDVGNVRLHVHHQFPRMGKCTLILGE